MSLCDEQAPAGERRWVKVPYAPSEASPSSLLPSICPLVELGTPRGASWPILLGSWWSPRNQGRGAPGQPHCSFPSPRPPWLGHNEWFDVFCIWNRGQRIFLSGVLRALWQWHKMDIKLTKGLFQSLKNKWMRQWTTKVSESFSSQCIISLLNSNPPTSNLNPWKPKSSTSVSDWNRWTTNRP